MAAPVAWEVPERPAALAAPRQRWRQRLAAVAAAGPVPAPHPPAAVAAGEWAAV
jgi:hypothetical protein